LKPINPEAMMGLVPSGSRNVLAKSLDLPDGIVECCQRFVNAKPLKIDVISALITTAAAAPPAAGNDYPKEVTTRIFLNAAEIGLAQKLSIGQRRLETRLRAVLYLQFQVSLLRCLLTKVICVRSL
jgi:diacylglycerol kinase family enzyme